MALLSPTGGFLLGPMKTPRFSGILSADMEPQAPQDTPAAGLGSARAAGVKRSYGAATLDREADRCTEVCEAAQGRRAASRMLCATQSVVAQGSNCACSALHAVCMRQFKPAMCSPFSAL